MTVKVLKEFIYSIRHDLWLKKKAKEDYGRQSKKETAPISCFNWWDDDQNSWFKDRYANIVSNSCSHLNFASVFGRKEVLELVSSPLVFYSGENVHNPAFCAYSDHLLTNLHINLGLGFDYFENERYLRFPLWLMYMFNPRSQKEDIIAQCRKLRYPDISVKTDFCSMVASHDLNGLRVSMVAAINQIGHVCCPGKLLHNDDTLIDQFNDNKSDYLKQFKFNICPENSNSMGYVTEKIFESIQSGCIPIYWGSYNDPEPGILNKEAIIFWGKDGDNSASLQLIESLLTNEQEYLDFVRQPRLLDGAEDIIWEMMSGLDERIAALL